MVDGLIPKVSRWKLMTGFDANSTYVTSLPTGTKSAVLPSDYELGYQTSWFTTGI